MLHASMCFHDDAIYSITPPHARRSSCAGEPIAFRFSGIRRWRRRRLRMRRLPRRACDVTLRAFDVATCEWFTKEYSAYYLVNIIMSMRRANAQQRSGRTFMLNQSRLAQINRERRGNDLRTLSCVRGTSLHINICTTIYTYVHDPIESSSLSAEHPLIVIVMMLLCYVACEMCLIRGKVGASVASMLAVHAFKCVYIRLGGSFDLITGKSVACLLFAVYTCRRTSLLKRKTVNIFPSWKL